MKRLLVFVVLTGVLAASLEKPVCADMEESPHDFSTQLLNPSREICKVCHTPYNAEQPMAVPLWNHETTVAVFTLYGSPTTDANVRQPEASSRACLSCHDGTVAYDSVGEQQGSRYLYTGFNLTTDLSDDHPISFTYDSALAAEDGKLYDPAVAPSGLGGTIKEDLLVDDQVQCISCHRMHRGSSVHNPRLLVKSNLGSALCLTCHNK